MNFTPNSDEAPKVNRPPGQDARTELARLKGVIVEPAPAIDLGRYAAFEVAC